MRTWIPLLLFVPAVAAQDAPFAIRNATVETLSAAGRIERATVVVRDGKIVAVGPNVAIPDDATIVDAEGGTVMPGVIDPYFEVSVAAATADAGPRTTTVRGRTINIPTGGPTRGGGFTRLADNFFAADPGFKPLPRVGLTRLNLVTSGTGQSAVVRVTPKSPERMMDRPDGVAYASITNSTESLDQVRARLESGSRSRTGPSAGAALWADVFEGKVPLVAEAANSAAVLHLLKALDPYPKVKLVLYLSGEAVAETVTAFKGRAVKAIVRPSLDFVPNTRDRYNPARKLHEAGIEFAFSMTARPPSTGGGGPGGGGGPPPGDDAPTATAIDPDFPLFPVAMLVRAGLPRTVALEALGKRPAALLGLDGSHGTIEVGKAADLLLFSGDPLDPASRLRRTIVDGRVVYEN